jgi:hypothetical protein
MHTHAHAAAKFTVKPRGSVFGGLSNSTVRRLAGETCIGVGVLLLWALLSAWILSTMDKTGGPGSCVNFGRAGTHCVETSGSGANNSSASRQECQLLGRAGRDCQAKTPTD